MFMYIYAWSAKLDGKTIRTDSKILSTEIFFVRNFGQICFSKKQIGRLCNVDARTRLVRGVGGGGGIPLWCKPTQTNELSTRILQRNDHRT